MASRTFGSFIAILLLVLATLGCESKEQFEFCDMSAKMKSDCEFDTLDAICDPLQTTCYASCMVGDHPQCLDGPCMIFQFRELGSADTYMSTSFCTFECADNEFCPEMSTCLQFLNKKFCVPDEHIVQQ